MKRKIFRLYLKLKNNYMYFFNTKIDIGFNIANLFCNIELFNHFFNFLFRIVWIKKYLFCKWDRREKFNDEARVICNLTIRKWNYYTTFTRDYFNRLIFEKTIYCGEVFLSCSFVRNLETSIIISIFYDEVYDGVSDQKVFYRDIRISLFGFRIWLGKH